MINGVYSIQWVKLSGETFLHVVPPKCTSWQTAPQSQPGGYSTVSEVQDMWLVNVTDYVIGWSKYRFGDTFPAPNYGLWVSCKYLQYSVGSRDRWEYPQLRLLTTPLHNTEDRQMPVVSTMRVECERVFSSWQGTRPVLYCFRVGHVHVWPRELSFACPICPHVSK